MFRDLFELVKGVSTVVALGAGSALRVPARSFAKRLAQVYLSQVIVIQVRDCWLICTLLQ